VGIARRLGTAAALSHFEQTDRRRLWLAHTDADTCVAVDWLRRQLPLAEAGSGAIAGIIRLAAAGGVGKRLTEQLMVDYQIGVDGTHPHVHGANLGVRADAYLDVGGWSDLKVAEDHCLWRRLGQRGWRLTSTAASVVLTSGRLHGRAAGGLADTLRDKAEHLRV
jgi:cellulose synthase/poly-beta-1,6-N-acetylglucosamine synthase-like glycosyltransferase